MMQHATCITATLNTDSQDNENQNSEIGAESDEKPKLLQLALPCVCIEVYDTSMYDSF
jgi:hypothetical protein